MMLTIFFLLFSAQQEQKLAFLGRVEGFNLAECATWTPPESEEKSSLYLPYFCWLEQGQSHSTRDTHKCKAHGAMCFTISNGDMGKALFFSVLENKQLDCWSYAEFSQECTVPRVQLRSVEDPRTFVEIFCYKQRFETALNTSLFKTCLSGKTYYLIQQRKEEDRIAREKQRYPQGMVSTSGEFVPAMMLTSYFQRMSSQC